MMESVSDQPKATALARAFWAILIVIAAVALDQASKIWALRALGDGQRIDLPGKVFSLILTHNSGAAFSLGASTTWIFTVLAIVIIAALIYGLLRTSSLSLSSAMALLLGGAIGNLIDRLTQPPSFGQGHVVDFIDYAGFFVGNVADIWIVLGAIWIAAVMVFADTSPEDRHE